MKLGGPKRSKSFTLTMPLDLKGTLVTADAIHCQNDTAALVLARGGDYLLALKGNQPAMRAKVEAFFGLACHPQS